jgi:hypothetical protein
MSDTNEDTLIKFQEEYLQDEIVLKEELLGDSSFSFFQLIKNFLMLRNMQVANSRRTVSLNAKRPLSAIRMHRTSSRSRSGVDEIDRGCENRTDNRSHRHLIVNGRLRCRLVGYVHYLVVRIGSR